MKCIHGVSVRSPCAECDGYKPVVPPAVAEYAVKERQAHIQKLERLAGIIAEVVTVSGVDVPDDANLGPGPDICSLGDEAVRELKAQREKLLVALADAKYRIEQGRVWNGMGWTLTGLSPHGQQKALDAIDLAISAADKQHPE